MKDTYKMFFLSFTPPSNILKIVKFVSDLFISYFVVNGAKLKCIKRIPEFPRNNVDIVWRGIYLSKPI